ncbi:MAG: helix-turn-helix transcriptional regulator [Rhodocyclales bacterium]|nr:helix-turn-helix transcriptional regulator [Rhodocyclales bacterium]
MKLKIYTAAEVRELRRKSGQTQYKFWQCLHITQSGGSRYESGHKMPAPVQLLLNITFGTEAKSAACVNALRELAKPPKKTKAPKPAKPAKEVTAFGMLP